MNTKDSDFKIGDKIKWKIAGTNTKYPAIITHIDKESVEVENSLTKFHSRFKLDEIVLEKFADECLRCGNVSSNFSHHPEKCDSCYDLDH